MWSCRATLATQFSGCWRWQNASSSHSGLVEHRVPGVRQHHPVLTHQGMLALHRASYERPDVTSHVFSNCESELLV